LSSFRVDRPILVNFLQLARILGSFLKTRIMQDNSHVNLPSSMRRLRPGARVLGVAGAEEWIEATIKIRRKKPLPELKGRPVRRLSLGELEAEYGADPAASKLVKSELTRLGMRIIREDAVSSSLRVGAPASIMEQAFRIRLFHYAHPSGNYRGRVGELSVPANLQGAITGVFGLDTRRMVKRRKLRKRAVCLEMAARAAASRSWFFPAELASVYSFPDGDGQGQLIGVLEFGGGYFPDDLATFCQNANVGVPEVDTVSVNDTPTNLRDGAEGEVMLDVEVIAGVCPSASVVVYFSSFDEGGWVDALDTAVHDKDHPLSVISVSWGYAEDAQGAWSEGAIDTINDTLKAAALLGITICVASGDDGSDDEVGDGHAHVDFPSSSPYVLGVGGTTLEAKKGGGFTETAWKDGDGLRQDNGGSTGGGVSAHFLRPDWQTVTVKSVNPGAIDGRIVPDVAADASANTGYWTVVDGQGGASGGTSAAAPLWATLIARINENLGAKGPVGYLTPLLYQATQSAKTLGQAGCRDITQGNNSTAAVGGYPAGAGYDAVTGWGVPVGNDLLTALQAILPGK
jgi:kumamolisin